MIKITTCDDYRVQCEYFNLLNPVSKDKKYQGKKYQGKEPYLETSLIKELKAEAAKTAGNTELKKFWEYLTKEDNLKELLISKPCHLSKLYIPPVTVVDKELKEWFETQYNKLRNKHAYWFAEVSGVRICPYCNINYIYSFKKVNGEWAVLFDLDHFIPKNTNPWFALSFYNLIPCCSTCNSRLKGDKTFRNDTHVHPYEKGFSNDTRFSLDVKDIDDFVFSLKKGAKYQTIKIDVNVNDAADRENIGVFELEKRYNQHSDYVHELIKKSIYYAPSYITSLYEGYPDLFSSEEEIKRLVLGNYFNEEDFHRRPLAKLTRDIAKELGLL